MSKLEVDAIEPQSGTTLTLGASGDTITVPSGATLSGTSLALAGNIGIGGATPTTSGTGITFPAAASGSTDANTLDDYEEGTWTPEISGGTTAGTGTYAVQNGRYTKIGNQVTICCYMNITAHTGTGLMRLSNFPFTILNVTNLFQGVSIGLFKNVTLPASSIPYAYAVFNTTLANVQSIPLGGGGTTDVAVDGSCEISFSLTYLT